MTLELTLLTGPGSAEWMDRAKCLAVAPDSMQPDRATVEEVAEAKALCAGCPVLLECRSHARAQAGAYGVHAGEWWGEEPVWVVERTCAGPGCSKTFRTEANGQRAALCCSSRCRVARHRAQAVSA